MTTACPQCARTKPAELELPRKQFRTLLKAELPGCEISDSCATCSGDEYVVVYQKLSCTARLVGGALELRTPRFTVGLTPPQLGRGILSWMFSYYETAAELPVGSVFPWLKTQDKVLSIDKQTLLESVRTQLPDFDVSFREPAEPDPAEPDELGLELVRRYDLSRYGAHVRLKRLVIYNVAQTPIVSQTVHDTQFDDGAIRRALDRIWVQVARGRRDLLQACPWGDCQYQEGRERGFIEYFRSVVPPWVEIRRAADEPGSTFDAAAFLVDATYKKRRHRLEIYLSEYGGAVFNRATMVSHTFRGSLGDPTLAECVRNHLDPIAQME